MVTRDELLAPLPARRLVLASNSPRRKELLAGLDVDFEVRVIPGIDETYPHDLPADEVPLYVAKLKALPYLDSLAPGELLLTADTAVILHGEVMGKPHDGEEAKRMLRALSGQTHHVVTGVCLVDRWRRREFAVTTEVDFKPLSQEEIDYYVDRYRPLDKAGAYGIQEWIGYTGCRGLRGSYYNVMGLPVQRVYQELKDCPRWASLPRGKQEGK